MPDDFTTPPQQIPPLPPPQAPAPPPGYYPPPGYAPAPAVPAGQYASSSGPVGRIRSTGICILLCVVTLGIYALAWFFMVHDEMRRHTGRGLGGVLALVIALLFGIVMPFLNSNEVADLYERVGRRAPVTALTGLWYFPGALILIGPIVWFVKTNGALNDYWRSVGAVRA
jgi:quinol-cytochrome oxidoreductase complex cytochrome b subunit